MKVSAGHVVRIDCELKVSGGDVIESSKKSGPVEYKHGGQQMLKVLQCVVGPAGVSPERATAGQGACRTVEA